MYRPNYAQVMMLIGFGLILLFGLSATADVNQVRESGDPIIGSFQWGQETTSPVALYPFVPGGNIQYASLQQRNCLRLAGQRLMSASSKFFIAVGTYVGGLLLSFGLIFVGIPTGGLILPFAAIAAAGFVFYAYWEIGAAGGALMQC